LSVFGKIECPTFGSSAFDKRVVGGLARPAWRVAGPTLDLRKGSNVLASARPAGVSSLREKGCPNGPNLLAEVRHG
jgi:hypothetical protein